MDFCVILFTNQLEKKENSAPAAEYMVELGAGQP